MARIPVIEDNTASMKLASLLTAIDAEAGLALARAERHDLILMDSQLPGMDGLAATAPLKQDPVTASIPVSAVTAMVMTSDREQTPAAGCDGYISKPLRYRELHACIDASLGMSAPRLHPDGG